MVNFSAARETYRMPEMSMFVNVHKLIVRVCVLACVRVLGA